MRNLIESQVIQILDKVQILPHLSRKKFFTALLLGVIESRKVQFSELAISIPLDIKTSSIERRIQAFFKDVEFDYAKVCLLLVCFLPKGKLRLSIDRTEWDFGKYQCNILMIVAKQGNIGIPLYWTMLDNKSGNSNAEDRCKLLEKIIKVIGKERIDFIVGDREFVGIKWIKYLKNNDIRFCMRVPKNHLITLKNNERYSIEELLTHKKVRFFQDCMVDGVICNAYLKQQKDGDFLFLIGNMPVRSLGKIYRCRWCIEVLFQNFKKRGFNLADTHLKDSKKLSKLLVLVSIAVGICVSVGTYYHEKVQQINTKKHGYKSNSMFRKGLDILRRGLKIMKEEFIVLWKNCTFIFARWIDIQVSYSQTLRKIIG